MKKILISLIILLLPFSASAENQLTPEQIRAEVDRIKLTALDTFKEYLAIPNDGHMPDDIAVLADWVENAFERRGFEVSRLAEKENPLLYAKRMDSQWTPAHGFSQIHLAQCSDTRIPTHGKTANGRTSRGIVSRVR